MEVAFLHIGMHSTLEMVYTIFDMRDTYLSFEATHLFSVEIGDQIDA